MHLKKEQYRKFEHNLLIYLEAPTEAFTPVEVPKEPEAKEETKEAEKAAELDMPEEIKKHKDRVNVAIKKIEDSIPENQKESAKVFLDQLRTKVDKDFDEIMKEYLELIKKGELSYKDSISQKAIERKAEDLADRIIKRDLKGREAVKTLTKEFLKEAPNTDAQENEKKFLTDLIQANPLLKKNYGEEGESKHLEKVINLLARKFDLRFDDKGNLLYGIDLSDNKVYGPEGKENLKDKITTLLKGDEYKPENLRKERREIRKEIRGLRKDLIEVKRNKLFHREGGKVNTWEEFTSGKHKALEDLREVDKKVKDQVEGIKETKKIDEAKEKVDKIKTDIITRHNDFLKTADLRQKFNDAKEKGYDIIKHDQPDFKENFKDVAVLKSKDGQTEITVTVEKELITLKIDNNNPDTKFKTERSFSNVEDFKKVNLANEAEQQGANIKANKKSVESFELARNQEGVKELIPPKTYTDIELTNPNFTIEPQPIIFPSGETAHQVGTLTAKESNNFTIEIDGQITAGVKKEKLPKTLKGLEEKMKEAAQKAEKTKTEIQTQATATENEIFKGADYTVEKKQKLEGNFTNLKGYVEIATLKRAEDQTIAARISMAVGGEAGKRSYQLEREDGGKELFKDIKELNLHLTEKGGEIAKLPDKAEVLSEPKDMKEKAKNNIIKNIERIYPNLKLEIGGKYTENYLNKIMNYLGEKNPELLKKIAAAENGLTVPLSKEELKVIKEATMKAVGIDKVEKADDEEIKVIGEFEVKIGDKTQTFKEVFGEDVTKMVSMTQEVSKQDGQIKIKEGDQLVPATPEKMVSGLATFIKENCQKILTGEIKDASKLKESSKYMLQSMENMVGVKELINSPVMVKQMEQLSGMEAATSWIQTLVLLFKWIGEGDYETAADALKAQELPGGINGAIENSKEKYKEGVKTMNLSDLSIMYKNPSGPEAKAAFPGALFKRQLRDVIKERMTNILGGQNVVNIEDWDENNQLKVKSGRREFAMSLSPSPNNDKVEIKETTEGIKDEFKSYDISVGLTGNGQSLETVFAQLRAAPSPVQVAPAPPVAPEAPAVAPKAEKAVKEPKKK